MKINIIGTGSTGNCIIFDEKIMIDAGLSFNKIKGHIKNVSIVLLTHEHGDHFSSTTARKLFLANEAIKFCCNDRMCSIMSDAGIPKRNIIKIEPGKVYQKDGVMFSPVSLYHDVDNYGYRLIKDGYRHFHATDTVKLDGIKALDYNSATIETNYCIDGAMKIIDDSRTNNEFTHLERATKTHLSVDKAIDFIRSNRIKKFIPVHIGGLTKSHVLEKLKKCSDEFEIDFSEFST